MWDEGRKVAPEESRKDIDLPTRPNDTDPMPLSGHVLTKTKPRVKTLG
jgi:hypothetical protein